MPLGGLMVFGGVRSWGTTVIGVGTVLGAVGAAIHSLGLRLSAQNTDEATANDPRPPAILLRSFDDDEIQMGVREGSPFMPYSSAEPITFEQLVVEQLAETSPVLAIGRPGELLPALGAARTYVSDADWKARIDQFLSDCGLVLMILGPIDRKEGLAWELERIQSSMPLQKVLLLLPPLPEEDARHRWNAYADRMGGRLPRYVGSEIAAWFDADGTCVVRRGPVGGGTQARDAYCLAIDGFLKSCAPSPDVELVWPEPSSPGRWWRSARVMRVSVLLFGLVVTGWVASAAGLGKAGLPHALSPVNGQDYILAVALIANFGVWIDLLLPLGHWFAKLGRRSRIPRMSQVINFFYMAITVLGFAMLALTVNLTYHVGLAAVIAAGLADGDLIRVADDKADFSSILTLSPDGRYWTVSDYDNRVHAFDAKTGSFLFSTPRHEEKIKDVCFSKDGSQFVTFSSRESFFDRESDWKRRQWDLSSRAEVTPALAHDALADPKRHPDGILRLSKREFSPLVLGKVTFDTFERWDTLTTFDYEHDRIRQFGFTPDGKSIFVARNDEARTRIIIDLWDVEPVRFRRRYTLALHAYKFAVSPSLNLLLYNESYALTLRRLPKIEDWNER